MGVEDEEEEGVEEEDAAAGELAADVVVEVGGAKCHLRGLCFIGGRPPDCMAAVWTRQ